MNIVMQVVGSRGDVQPFVALGKILKEEYGHRVRLATHPIFQSFVEDNGLEFFSVGGDPVALMAFMVKNPKFLPSIESIRSGDVIKQRHQMFDIFKGCWRSCIESGDGMGDVSRSGRSTKPFVADAIIANPPSFAHIHCAERLGIPLHLMFTMPWSPTREFPHPLARITSTNADPGLTNFVSYAIVKIMIWQGLGGLVNQFRKKALGLEPVSLVWAPGLTNRLKIPYTYLWSPALIPKPRDWNSNIHVTGFCHLAQASSFSPSRELVEFLSSGPPPIYIGFGSIVVKDSAATTKLILEAVRKAGVRAILSRGWGGFAAKGEALPDEIFPVDNIPHDWLFPRVSCVVHHGGAGTTAAGIASGTPTVIIPFFGDQPFWGMVVARAGAGPPPIPFRDLTTDSLAAAIKAALQPDVREKVRTLACIMRQESGAQNAARSFHTELEVHSLRCSMSPNRTAVWRLRDSNIHLSALAAEILVQDKALAFSDLQRYRPKEYDLEDGPWDPISGGASALLGTLASLVVGAAVIPTDIIRALKLTPAHLRRPHDARELDSMDERCDLVSKEFSKAQGSDQASPRGPLHSFKYKSMIDTQTKNSKIKTANRAKTEKEGHSFFNKMVRISTKSRTSTRDSSAVPKDCSSDATTSTRCLSPGPNTTSPQEDQGNLGTSHTECQYASKFALEKVSGRQNSVGRVLISGLKFPMDFILHVAKGFHNAPQLYGDTSVRPLHKIEGLKSGLEASAREFVLGFYDGASGLVMLPIRGGKTDGIAGFLGGIGKGGGGLVLKPLAAICGLPGYALHGAYKEIQKHFEAGPNCVHLARTLQGIDEAKAVSDEERISILKRWAELDAAHKTKVHHGNWK